MNQVKGDPTTATQTDRQTDKQTDRQTDRLTNLLTLHVFVPPFNLEFALNLVTTNGSCIKYY